MGSLGSSAQGVTVCTASLILLALGGCATTNTPRSLSVASTSGRFNKNVEQQLRDHERRWHGVPYRWGGLSRDGVDCSGFVMTAYRELFGLSLPRATGNQVRVGQAVPQDELQAGDLVFFHLPGRARHVGLYLGAGEFAHASTSEGVTISHLDETYWRKGYWTTRRVLPPPDMPPSADLVEEPLPQSRVGW
jgi:cell wall-associated NlpC family hydrolase